MDVTAANAHLDNNYGDDAGVNAPATHYVALFKDDTWAVELTTTAGVDRLPITNDSTNWPDAVDGAKENAVELTSDDPTDVWADDAQAWALMSAPTGGYRGIGGDLDDPIENLGPGSPVVVAVGALAIVIDTD